MVEPCECLVIPVHFPDARPTVQAPQTVQTVQTVQYMLNSFRARLAMTLGLQILQVPCSSSGLLRLV